MIFQSNIVSLIVGFLCLLLSGYFDCKRTKLTKTFLTEPTKAGMCPFLSPSLCNSTLLGANSRQCTSDEECEHTMKCCAAGDCTICADPLLKQDLYTTKKPSSSEWLYKKMIKNTLEIN